VAPSTSASVRSSFWTVCIPVINLFSFNIYIDPDFLADSPFAGDVEKIVRCFDETIKLRFRKDEERHYIKFGSIRDKDRDHNIRSGQLMLTT
jgi:hypothetical protein